MDHQADKPVSVGGASVGSSSSSSTSPIHSQQLPASVAPAQPQLLPPLPPLAPLGSTRGLGQGLQPLVSPAQATSNPMSTPLGVGPCEPLADGFDSVPFEPSPFGSTEQVFEDLANELETDQSQSLLNELNGLCELDESPTGVGDAVDASELFLSLDDEGMGGEPLTGGKPSVTAEPPSAAPPSVGNEQGLLSEQGLITAQGLISSAPMQPANEDNVGLLNELAALPMGDAPLTFGEFDTAAAPQARPPPPRLGSERPDATTQGKLAAFVLPPSAPPLGATPLSLPAPPAPAAFGAAPVGTPSPAPAMPAPAPITLTPAKPAAPPAAQLPGRPPMPGMAPMSIALQQGMLLQHQGLRPGGSALPYQAVNPNASLPSVKSQVKWLPGAVATPAPAPTKQALGGRPSGPSLGRTFSWQPIKFPVYK